MTQTFLFIGICGVWMIAWELYSMRRIFLQFRRDWEFIRRLHHEATMDKRCYDELGKTGERK